MKHRKSLKKIYKFFLQYDFLIGKYRAFYDFLIGEKLKDTQSPLSSAIHGRSNQ